MYKAFKTIIADKDTKDDVNKKKKRKVSKNGTKFKKRSKLSSDENIPIYVPRVGPVRRGARDNRIIIVGSISNMNHERQVPTFKVIESKEQ